MQPSGHSPTEQLRMPPQLLELYLKPDGQAINKNVVFFSCALFTNQVPWTKATYLAPTGQAHQPWCDTKVRVPPHLAYGARVLPQVILDLITEDRAASRCNSHVATTVRRYIDSMENAAASRHNDSWGQPSSIVSPPQDLGSLPDNHLAAFWHPETWICNLQREHNPPSLSTPHFSALSLLYTLPCNRSRSSALFPSDGVTFIQLTTMLECFAWLWYFTAFGPLGDPTGGAIVHRTPILDHIQSLVHMFTRRHPSQAISALKNLMQTADGPTRNKIVYHCLLYWAGLMREQRLWAAPLTGGHQLLVVRAKGEQHPPATPTDICVNPHVIQGHHDHMPPYIRGFPEMVDNIEQRIQHQFDSLVQSVTNGHIIHNLLEPPAWLIAKAVPSLS